MMNLEAKTKEIMDKCDNLMELGIKASGGSTMELLSSIDSETGAMIGGCMDVYKGSKEFAIMQAKAIDTLIVNFDELKAFNEDLRKQNEELQQLLLDISKEIYKGAGKEKSTK